MRTLVLPRAVRSIGDSRAKISGLWCDSCRKWIEEPEVLIHIHGTKMKEVKVE